MTLIFARAGNALPLIWTAVLGGPEEGVMLNIFGADTMRVAAPCIPVRRSVAVICALPGATPVASPWEPEVLETVAAEVFDDDHMAVVVMFWVLWSE
jgi:hypothetical protein